ncbi:DNA-binding response regulator [Sphingomonas koreensis]|nr:DNA-binding response regulator [Sphingomonas koreensis]
MADQRFAYLVDDDDAVRRSIGFMLRNSGIDVTSYASGHAFLKDAKTLAPGAVLLDMRMPEMDGLEVQQLLNKRGVTLPVIVLTGHGDVSVAVQAMKAGAVDFIEKPFEKTVLLTAITRAEERLERSHERFSAEREALLRVAVLTSREQDVLRELARGHPNKTIAYDLGISPRTVEVHRANLMSKLGARSLSEALRIAFAAQLGADKHRPSIDTHT